jgi:hypothetical protein
MPRREEGVAERGISDGKTLPDEEIKTAHSVARNLQGRHIQILFVETLMEGFHSRILSINRFRASLNISAIVPFCSINHYLNDF